MTHFGDPLWVTTDQNSRMGHHLIPRNQHGVHSNHGWIRLKMGIETKYKPRNVDMVLIISKMADLL